MVILYDRQTDRQTDSTSNTYNMPYYNHINNINVFFTCPYQIVDHVLYNMK